MMELQENLKNIKNDYAAMVLNSLAGVVPYAGTFIGTVITQLIPNQRMERFMRYCEKILSKINEHEEEIKECREKISLIEKGAILSTNSDYLEKCDLISNIVNNCLDNNIEVSLASSIIGVVNELNKEQLIILYYNSLCNDVAMVEAKKVYDKFEKYHGIIDETHIMIADSEEVQTLKLEIIRKYELNINNLIRLGLFKKPEIDFNSLKQKGDMDRYSGMNDVKSLKHVNKIMFEEIVKEISELNGKPHITELGKRVIKEMVIHDEIFF